MKKTILFKCSGAVLLFSVLFLSFASLKIIAAEKKPRLVLLPVSGENISASDRDYYEASLKESLSDQYEVFSGEKVLEALNKTSDTVCTSEECLENIAISFNGELVARGTVDMEGSDAFLKIEIKNVFTHRDIFTKTDGCSGCSKNEVAAKLKGMTGRSSSGYTSSGAVEFASPSIGSRGPEKGGVSKITPTVTGDTTSGVAALFIDSEPTGATVYLGDAIAGETPYKALNLKAGQVIRVSLKKDEYHAENLEFRLSGGINDLGAVKLKPRFGTLSVTSKPSGADVFLAGRKVGETPYINKRVVSGPYLLTLTKELYQSVENQKIEIADEKTTEKHFDLKTDFGTLELSSTPSGANVIIKRKNSDIVHRKVSPFSIGLNPGTYEVKIEKEGYEPVNYTVNITDKGKEVITPENAVLRRYEGNVIVSSDPYEKGAEVSVNGVVMGRIPASFSLPAGEHEIIVKTKKLYGKQKIKVKDRETLTADVKLKEGGESITNDLAMKFVWVKPGTFMMGSPESEKGRSNDEKLHRVTLTKGFYMQTTAVTQGQWKKVMGNNPSSFKNCGDDCPVEQVSWNDVKEFIKKLNSMDRSRVYRLPTEAEWEYACRAGTATPFNTGSCLSTDQANYNGNYPLEGCLKGEYRRKPVPVGSFPPNAWGLYDMHGNVWEWCEDWYDDYPSGAVTDPVGPSSGSDRVYRGGSWDYYAWRCRSASRSGCIPSYRNVNLGFRLVCLQAGQ